MTEMITDKQIKKMAKVFLRSGRTFQKLASEAGLTNTPDHLSELTRKEARKFLKFHGAFLVTPKDKQ